MNALTDQRDAKGIVKSDDERFRKATGLMEQTRGLGRGQVALEVELNESASRLFREIITDGWRPDRFVAEARIELKGGRRAEAIDHALGALQKEADYQPALSFLREIRDSAANGAESAAREAQKAGATEANSPAFKEARARQTDAAGLKAPGEIRNAVEGFDAARAGYVRAGREAQQFALDRSRQVDSAIGLTQQRLNAQDRAGALAAWQDAARLNPADPRLPGLRTRIDALDAAVPAPPSLPTADAAARADVAQAISEARAFTDDVAAIARLNVELSRYPGNVELTNAVAARVKARDDKVTDLVGKAKVAPDAQAIVLLTSALALDPRRSDIAGELERRKRVAAAATTLPGPPTTPPTPAPSTAELRVRVETEVNEALGRYKTAYEAKNLDDLLRVAPYLRRADVEKDFSGFQTLQMTIAPCTITPADETGTRAAASCRVNRKQQLAGTRPPGFNRDFQFTLTKDGSGWRIISATSVPAR